MLAGAGGRGWSRYRPRPYRTDRVEVRATTEILETPVLTRNVEDFERLDVPIEPY